MCDINDEEIHENRRKKSGKPSPSAKKDTGYSTASSHTSKSTDEKYRIRSGKHLPKGGRRELKDGSDEDTHHRKHTDRRRRNKPKERKESGSRESW